MRKKALQAFLNDFERWYRLMLDQLVGLEGGASHREWRTDSWHKVWQSASTAGEWDS
jgi:hypothetical protein